jgi:RNA polymerase sigma-70 factor (ECF subfamily)
MDSSSANIEAAQIEPRPDHALVERIRASDPVAFREAVVGLYGTLRRLARAYLRSESMIDEVIQDTWCMVVASIHQFEGRSSFRTWVCRILMNRARTLAVRDARTVPMSSLGDDDDEGGESNIDRFTAAGTWDRPPAAWVEEDPARLASRQELLTLIERALVHLPKRQRMVVVLRDVHGWSADEVCTTLGLRETNQRVLLHRGRARLREVLEPHLTSGSC